MNANVNGGCEPYARRREARSRSQAIHEPCRFWLRRVVSSSRVRACASARVGAHAQMGRDNETITERDICLCLRVAPRVCTLGTGSAVDVDIDDYGAWPAAQVHGAREVACTCRRAGGRVHLHSPCPIRCYMA